MDLETLTMQYWTAVQLVRHMAVPEADKVVVPADVEVNFRRERAGKLGALLAQSPTKTDIPGNTQQ